MSEAKNEQIHFFGPQIVNAVSTVVTVDIWTDS